MTDHPITPPPELLSRWEEDWHHAKVKHTDLEDHITTQAARWGADQELEACIEWITGRDWTWTSAQLLAARRPSPPSLKEQALEEVGVFEGMGTCNIDIIRRALEQLDD